MVAFHRRKERERAKGVRRRQGGEKRERQRKNLALTAQF
jgi:hypothetical protein